MENLVRNHIAFECRKHVSRHYEYLFELDEITNRKERRNGQTELKEIRIPEYWQVHDGFNPFIVRRKKRLALYSYTISRALKSLTYRPRTSISHSIPKLSGGTRELNIFQVPDSAISRMVYKELLSKNVNLFSAYAYAYREDRNAHDAIARLSSDWKNRERVYVAEFDFSKFFDQINHDYLWNVLRTRGFLYTEIEEHILKAFLESTSSKVGDYHQGEGTVRSRGIPQGTSISLFLANVACWELDLELERLDVQFARYADDTLVWSNSYDQIVRAFSVIDHFSKLMGVPINFNKSDGITLVSEQAEVEMRSKSRVSFLGYDIGVKQVSISNKGVEQIKNRISYIIYANLLQPLNRGIYNIDRLNGLDWDYVTALAQVRRYLYGGLNDRQLQKFKFGGIPRLTFRGLMSYYPLVSDEEQLKMLDGWLIHTLSQALRKRQKMWLSKGVPLPGPTQDWIELISSLKRWKSTTGKIFDLRIPSFLLINRAMKVALSREGLKGVTNPKSSYYSESLPPKVKP